MSLFRQILCLDIQVDRAVRNFGNFECKVSEKSTSVFEKDGNVDENKIYTDHDTKPEDKNKTEVAIFGVKKKKVKKKNTNSNEKTERNPKLTSGDLASLDSDYTYDDLLDRAYCILRTCNPELKREKKKIILKPPQVAREGAKRTAFINFQELCTMMNRSQEHVKQFMLAELGAGGSLDGSMRLLVKGRFLAKDFEKVLRQYMIEYVVCNSCKSAETILDRDQISRLLYIKCTQCGASRSVTNVNSGFQARVTSRRADRIALS